MINRYEENHDDGYNNSYGEQYDESYDESYDEEQTGVPHLSGYEEPYIIDAEEEEESRRPSFTAMVIIVLLIISMVASLIWPIIYEMMDSYLRPDPTPEFIRHAELYGKRLLRLLV